MKKEERITKIVQTASPKQEDMEWLVIQYIKEKTGQDVEINMFKHLGYHNDMFLKVKLSRELNLLNMAYQTAAEYYGEKIRNNELQNSD